MLLMVGALLVVVVVEVFERASIDEDRLKSWLVAGNGGKLVDAKGVSRLYRPRVSARALAVLVLAALATMLIAVAVTPAGQIVLRYLSIQWDVVRYWLAGLF